MDAYVRGGRRGDDGCLCRRGGVMDAGVGGTG